MTKPRELGVVANVIVSGAIERVAENQAQLFEAVALVYGGDKKAAVEALKVVAANEAVVFQALALLRAGDVRAAEEVLLDARLEK